MRTLHFVPLALGLALGSPWNLAAAAAANDQHRARAPGETRAVLQIDTSAVGTSGPAIQRRLEERGNVVLRRFEVLPGEAAADPVVTISIHELTGEDPGYTYAVWVSRGGTEVGGSRRTGECDLCTEGELVEAVEDELETVMPFVREAGRTGAPAPEDGDATEEAGESSLDSPAPASTPPEGDGRDRPALDSVGKAGIGVLAAGVVGLGTGLALAIREPTVAQAEPTKLFTTRPAGYAVIGVGAAAVVTGAVLLILDRRRASSKVALSPLVGPRGAGLHLEGRF